MKTKIFSLITVITICFTACKKSDSITTPTPTSTTLEATWNLDLWDGVAATGSLVFTATTMNFTKGTSNEQTTYVKNANNTLTFTKTGGNIVWISGGNDWTIDSLTTNVLRMHSKYNLVVRCTK